MAGGIAWLAVRAVTKTRAAHKTVACLALAARVFWAVGLSVTVPRALPPLRFSLAHRPAPGILGSLEQIQRPEHDAS